MITEVYRFSVSTGYVGSVYNNDEPSRIAPKRARKHELDLILITMGALNTEFNMR